MNNNGKPLTNKQTVRFMVGLTILAWATQTLVHQWGYGQTIQSTESFVGDRTSANSAMTLPAMAATPAVGTTLELRPEASVIGGDVMLRQICRWSDRDKSMFDPIGDLVLAHVGEQQPFRTLNLNEVRGLLHDAGVNIASINFNGALACTVSRSDVHYDEKTALKDWADAKTADAVTASAHVAPAPATSESVVNVVQSLKQILTRDLAQNLQLPVESLQVDFKMTGDDKVINYTQPMFSFDIDSTHAHSLGSVSWMVAITGGGATKKTMIYATARAWQEQLVAAKPLAFHQIIRDGDVESKRVLVSDLGVEPPTTEKQVVGQLAARELKIGSQITGRCVDPIQLVKMGQFVTITLEQGSVNIKSVAKAIENGTYGQTIRVKNEQTGEVLQVVVTGAQTATMSLNNTVASAEGH